MKYINKDDLITCMQEVLLNNSIAGVDSIGDSTILDKNEKKVIKLVISYIGRRYNTTLIFNEETPIRDEVLVDIISCIVVYRVIRRNAARKVPEDIVDFYKDARKDLEKIQSGSLFLENLPLILAEDGTAKLLYGSNRNKDFFI